MLTIKINKSDLPRGCKDGICRMPVKYTYDTERLLHGEVNFHHVKFSCAIHALKEIVGLTTEDDGTIYNEDGTIYMYFAWSNKYVKNSLRKLEIV